MWRYCHYCTRWNIEKNADCSGLIFIGVLIPVKMFGILIVIVCLRYFEVFNSNHDYSNTGLYFLGPTLSRYYNVNVGLIMQLSDLSSKIWGLHLWGVFKIRSTDVGPRIVLKYDKTFAGGFSRLFSTGNYAIIGTKLCQVWKCYEKYTKKNFFEHIFLRIKGSLSGLFFITEKCEPKD